MLVIRSLVALVLLLAPSPANAQMKTEGGHGASHNQKTKPVAHGHSEKASPHGHKGQAGHKPANAHGAHQANVHPTKIPKNIDLDTTKFSEEAKFSVNIASSLNPIIINTMHSWVVQLKNPDGKPV
ncbi:MAG: hypothetical protein VYE18_06915, partial [Pseudomonadota bacterium]|nr:hypothetical protein [Pseudomonadota bacterium]